MNITHKKYRFHAEFIQILKYFVSRYFVSRYFVYNLNFPLLQDHLKRLMQPQDHNKQHNRLALNRHLNQLTNHKQLNRLVQNKHLSRPANKQPILQLNLDRHLQNHQAHQAMANVIKKVLWPIAKIA